jgi:RecA/RadA recombinase
MKTKDLLKGLRKKNDTKTAAESDAIVTDFYDTGSFALNRVITGNVHNGVPRGRITTIYGPSQSGKSLIAAQVVANALKTGQIDGCFWVDSEGGGTQLLKNFGADLEKVEYVPVLDAEDACVKLVNIYEQLVQAHSEWEKDPDNNDEPKYIVVLDSFGGLASSKVVSDAVDKDKMVADQGMAAKTRNSLIRTLMMRVVVSNCSLIVINHEYQNPGQMYVSKVHNMAGGQGIEYASHVILQASKLMVKEGDTEFSTGKDLADNEKHVGFFKGNRMRFFCTKNRVIKPAFEADVFIDFDTGISKYDGIIKDAVAYGFINEVRGGYVVPSYKDTRVTYKELVSKDEIWDTFIDKFNEESEKRMAYRSKSEDALAEIESEIEEIKDKKKNGKKQLIVEDNSDIPEA